MDHERLMVLLEMALEPSHQASGYELACGLEDTRPGVLHLYLESTRYRIRVHNNKYNVHYSSHEELSKISGSYDPDWDPKSNPSCAWYIIGVEGWGGTAIEAWAQCVSRQASDPYMAWVVYGHSWSKSTNRCRRELYAYTYLNKLQSTSPYKGGLRFGVVHTPPSAALVKTLSGEYPWHV